MLKWSLVRESSSPSPLFRSWCVPPLSKNIVISWTVCPCAPPSRYSFKRTPLAPDVSCHDDELHSCSVPHHLAPGTLSMTLSMTLHSSQYPYACLRARRWEGPTPPSTSTLEPHPMIVESGLLHYQVLSESLLDSRCRLTTNVTGEAVKAMYEIVEVSA